MEVTFSTHALQQLNERNLTRSIVEETVINPEKVIRQSGNRYKAVRVIPKHNKQYLLVVIYDKRGKELEIVTSFITSKIKKYL